MPTYSKPIARGAAAPDFVDLPGVDGRSYARADFAGKIALVVLFSCNHCPYVQAYEDRLNAIARDYGPRGIGMIAINANDTAAYPDDDFAAMVERARAKRFAFPYVRDDTQTVAAAFGAQCTPEVFIIDAAGRVGYHGGIDDNYREPEKVTAHWLRNALDDLVAGRAIAMPETRAIGCSIKWSSERPR
jgi:peroxiredoxin